MATVYKTIVQLVLPYGSESWVLTAGVLKQFGRFHRRCACFITGSHIRQNSDGTRFRDHFGAGWSVDDLAL
jgi:hypothetical protein